MASYLADRRRELGKTQKEVAEYVGVSEATVSRWESGDIANMRRDKIKKLAEVLNTTPAFVMGWDEDTAELMEEISSPVYQAYHEAVDALIKACGSENSFHMTQLVKGKPTLICYHPFPDNSSCGCASSIMSQMEEMGRDELGKLYLAVLAYKAADDRTRQMVDLALEPFIPSDLEGWI